MAKRAKLCGGVLGYRSIQGNRVYTTVGRRRVYEFQCTVCGHTGENSGMHRTCDAPEKNTDGTSNNGERYG